MKTKNIFLAMIVALMSTVICPAQEGESTKEGIAAVEEIVTDTDSSTDNSGGSNAATQHTTGSWTVTYTNDTLDTDEAVELLEEIFDEEFPEGIEGLMKTAMGAATA